jgi:hypothetical protein
VYLGDALDVAQPRKIEEKPQLDPKLMAWYGEAQSHGRGHTVGPRQLGYSPDMVCRYINGRHACYDYSDFCPAVESRVYVHSPEPQGILFTRRVA